VQLTDVSEFLFVLLTIQKLSLILILILSDESIADTDIDTFSKNIVDTFTDTFADIS